MKRFLVILLAGIAVALGTASTAQAHDRYRSSSRCYTPRYYSSGYSSGYCAPRTYYSSGYCAPRTYSRSYCAPRHYSSYSYAPRYYSTSRYSSSRCYRPSSGISIFFGR